MIRPTGEAAGTRLGREGGERPVVQTGGVQGAVSEVRRRLEVAGHNGVSASPDRDRSTVLEAQATEATRPDVAAGGPVAPDELVSAADRRERAAAEVDRALEGARDDHVAARRHREPPGAVVPGRSRTARPLM